MGCACPWVRRCSYLDLQMSATPSTSRSRRPASAFDPLQLLDIVRVVAEAAAPHASEVLNLRTRAWDLARALVPEAADAPAARRIAEALGLPWRRVLELSVMPEPGRSIRLGHELNEREGGWLTKDYCAYLLQLHASRLERQALTPSDYLANRAELAAGGQQRLRMPTEHQIAAVFGGWDRAAAYAGLRPRESAGGRPRRLPSAPIVDMLERCYLAHGTEPTNRELELFAKANGIKLPRRVKPWAEYVAEWRDGRRAAGLPVPDGPPPTNQRPDYTQDVGAGSPSERRSRKWSEDELVSWVARYLAELNGRRSSQRGYAAWARTQEGAPWTSAIQRRGGWNLIRRLAQQLLREGLNIAP